MQQVKPETQKKRKNTTGLRKAWCLHGVRFRIEDASKQGQASYRKSLKTHATHCGACLRRQNPFFLVEGYFLA
jgi:hypothetical protein